ncbi:MAG TPA: hypothetical protein VEH06_02440 [Candidatus Bathyarchaeia archaeon]|nr:hypothetical protein [Candidatus Bathyarchaeia archaeon]
MTSGFEQRSPYYNSIMNTKKWMFGDIQKSIDLEPKGAPNVLIALIMLYRILGKTFAWFGGERKRSEML